MKTKAEVLAELLGMHRRLNAAFDEHHLATISAQLVTLTYAIELVRQLPDEPPGEGA